MIIQYYVIDICLAYVNFVVSKAIVRGGHGRTRWHLRKRGVAHCFGGGVASHGTLERFLCPGSMGCFQGQNLQRTMSFSYTISL